MASIEGIEMFVLRRGGGKPKAHFCGFVEGLEIISQIQKKCVSMHFLIKTLHDSP